MSCLNCRRYCVEIQIRSVYRKRYADKIIHEMDNLGLDGYCSALGVCVSEGSCCSFFESSIRSEVE